MNIQRASKLSLPTKDIILTNGVRQCTFCLDLLADPNDPYITMAVITGDAGIGKSVAFQYYYDTFQSRTRSALPTLIKVEVVPRSSPRALAGDIMESLQERPRVKSGTVYEFAKEAAESMIRNDLRLLLLDEADRLNEETFELIRHLFDITACPIALIGLPSICSVIDRHEKFSSRVGLRLSFPTLDYNEFLQEVLPQLKLKHWAFDPQKETDQALAQELWKMIRPSFRKLTNMITLAGKMAGKEHYESITLDTLQEAFPFLASPLDPQLQAQQRKASTPLVTPLEGPQKACLYSVRWQRGSRRMPSNPFFDHSPFNLPLERDIYQRIHYAALVAATNGHANRSASECPETLSLPLLRQKAQRLGQNVYLLHPKTLDTVFAGVTLSIYQTIDRLYCSRFERHIAIVGLILNAMAREASTPPVTYEATWAICCSLESRLTHAIQVELHQCTTAWGVGFLSLEELSPSPACSEIACIVDLFEPRILAFRACERQAPHEDFALALYAALVDSRRPHQHTPTGLIWHVPQRLVAERPLPAGSRECCERLGILVEEQHGPLPFLQQVRSGWAQEVANRNIRADRWLLNFDSFLHKAYGYSPLRTSEHLEHEYHHLRGYGLDPAWQCPALRSLLPIHSARITSEGEIVFEGFHYEDDLLRYWPDTPVEVRPTEHTAARLWVYLDGALLCQAMARERRRHDGSYHALRRGW